MIIMWGFKNKTVILETGTFYCPHCNADVDYILKEVRHYFVLYRIPIIALYPVARYTQCQSCKTEYKPSMVLGTTEFDEVKNSNWDYALGFIAILSVSYFVLYGPSIITDFFTQRPEVQYVDAQGMQYYYPMKFFIGNGTDTAQKFQVTYDGVCGEVEVGKQGLGNFKIHQAGDIVVSFEDQTETITINKPDTVYVIYVDAHKKLGVKCAPLDELEALSCDDVFKSYLYR